MTSLSSRFSLFATHPVFLLLFLLLPVFAHAEYIESFQSDIDLYEDASFTVTETIDYRFTEDHHGIIRDIPLLHTEKASTFLKERIIDINLKSVTMDGEPVPYTLESTKNNFVVRIGDPNTLIQGAHTYALTYDVQGGLSYPKGQGTELYWNVTGNGWKIPLHFVSATVRSHDRGLFRAMRACYRGSMGEMSGSCATTTGTDGSITFRTSELKPGEGMTIAQSLEMTKVAKDMRERTKTTLIIIPLTVLGLLYGGYRLYRYKTTYKTDAPIIAQYEPYPGIKPMYTGLLMDGRLDPRDITACIVYLAQQGFLKIRRVEHKVTFFLAEFEVNDYEIELLKVPDTTVSRFEQAVLELLLNTPLTVGKTISLGDLKNNTSEQRENYKELQALEKVLDKDLEESSFYERKGFHKSYLIKAKNIVVLAVFAGIFLNVFTKTMQVVWICVSTVIVLIVLGFFISGRRTQKGYEIQDYLKGFKLFLETTERDRYTFHNAPEKSPEQFMEYLPYAIAFGVEEKWAKVFEGITVPNPDWYDGGSVGSFSATNLTTSLGAFSTAFAASSGASASSGGGSSGGGSGGGGGGSW